MKKSKHVADGSSADDRVCSQKRGSGSRKSGSGSRKSGSGRGSRSFNFISSNAHKIWTLTFNKRLEEEGRKTPSFFFSPILLCGLAFQFPPPSSLPLHYIFAFEQRRIKKHTQRLEKLKGNKFLGRREGGKGNSPHSVWLHINYEK